MKKETEIQSRINSALILHNDTGMGLDKAFDIVHKIDIGYEYDQDWPTPVKTGDFYQKYVKQDLINWLRRKLKDG